MALVYVALKDGLGTLAQYQRKAELATFHGTTYRAEAIQTSWSSKVEHEKWSPEKYRTLVLTEETQS